MGRGKTLNSEEIGRIKALNEEGHSNKEIARRINRSANVINNFLRDPENYGKNQKGGTKRATTERERRAILRESSNSAKTARQIKYEVGTSASVRTVQRIIKGSPTLKRMRLKKKPCLTQRHRQARLEFARNHMTWNAEWRKVIFSDEKRFSLDGPDSFQYYFHDLRKDPIYLSRRHSRVGSVMVWGAISYNGPVDLVIITEKQTAKKYKQLLRCQKPKIDEIMGEGEWIYQHDHAAIHTARVVGAWFSQENIQVLEWPSLSPDLNIIENLWGWLTRKVYESGRQYQNKDDLIKEIKEMWMQIPMTLIKNLYDSLPNRIFEVINKSGGNTHY